jgi:tetratricopeptide (TPR) repeat protein
MLEKAKFWYEHGHTDVALSTYNRVLEIEPGNVDALIGASKVSLDTGREDLVKSYAVQLRKVAPEDPFLASIDTAKRRSPADAAILQDARHLTVLGQRKEALTRYRILFTAGKVPDELAAEYYPLLLATLPQDSVEADDTLTALRTVAAAHPRDLNMQLGLAQGLIISEGSRSDGIDMLRELSHNELLANRVRVMWRQALLWQGPDVKAMDEVEEYLAENPNDAEMKAKLDSFRTTLPSKALRSRMLGYEAIRSGNMAEAEADFRAAINGDKTDADAWIMMGVVRLKQNRMAEAQTFIDQAVKLAPDRRQEFLEMVGQDPVSNAKYAADAARAVSGQYKEIASLTAAGQYDAAARQLRKLMGNRRDAGQTLELADLESRAGHKDAALVSLREAVAIDPKNPDATLALASALTAAGQTVEAQALFGRAEATFQAAGNQKALVQVHRAQADQMRRDALRLGDLKARETALQATLAVDPSSWWTRLELARVMQASGRANEARNMIADAERTAEMPHALDTQSGQEALQVAVVWAQERGDDAHALFLARLVPPNLRNAPLQALLAHGAFHDQVDDIMQASDYPTRLVAVASSPDPDGVRGEVMGRALLRIKDVTTLRSVLAASLVATPRPGTGQRLRYGGLLLEANQVGGARSVLEGVDRSNLSSDQRSLLEDMRERIVVSEADELVRKNRAGDAQVLLHPLLVSTPSSVRLQVAMARVDVALGRSVTALPTLQAALQRDPKDLAARMGAIEAATAAGKLSVADDLAREGVALFPNNPFILVQAANVAQARGQNGRALENMRKARELQATNVVSTNTNRAAN